MHIWVNFRLPIDKVHALRREGAMPFYLSRLLPRQQFWSGSGHVGIRVKQKHKASEWTADFHCQQESTYIL